MIMTDFDNFPQEEINKLQNRQGHCPFCDNTGLDYDSAQIDGDILYYPWTCKQCGLQGEEYYRLTFDGHNVFINNESYEL